MFCVATYEMDQIRGGVRHIEANTCIRFHELDSDEDVGRNTIVVTRASTGYVATGRHPPVHVLAHVHRIRKTLPHVLA